MLFMSECHFAVLCCLVPLILSSPMSVFRKQDLESLTLDLVWSPDNTGVFIPNFILKNSVKATEVNRNMNLNDSC